MKKPSGKIGNFLVWLGLCEPEERGRGACPPGGHDHVHGVIDPSVATTTRGVWAIKWSFLILLLTAVLQAAVVLMSGSTALFADMIHNLGDAATALPLWIAFRLARRGATPRFTFGFGRVEDLAGVAIVLLILSSAVGAGTEAVLRLLHPAPLHGLLMVGVAGLLGFVGNEAVAILRIRTGRLINSAALMADGYHARVDGLTSLAVVLGAVGVWLGFPLADPVVALLITLTLLGIVWQSGKTVFTRILDGVDRSVIEEIRHAASHVPGIEDVVSVRARWMGHRLVAELDVEVAVGKTVGEASAVVDAFEKELKGHLPAMDSAHIRIRPSSPVCL